MRVKRFLVPAVNSNSDTVLLSKDQTHHLKNVLRMKTGDECILADAKGYEFSGRIKSFSTDEAVVEILGQSKCSDSLST